MSFRAADNLALLAKCEIVDYSIRPCPDGIFFPL